MLVLLFIFSFSDQSAKRDGKQVLLPRERSIAGVLKAVSVEAAKFSIGFYVFIFSSSRNMEEIYYLLLKVCSCVWEGSVVSVPWR